MTPPTTARPAGCLCPWEEEDPACPVHARRSAALAALSVAGYANDAERIRRTPNPAEIAHAARVIRCADPQTENDRAWHVAAIRAISAVAEAYGVSLTEPAPVPAVRPESWSPLCRCGRDAGHQGSDRCHTEPEPVPICGAVYDPGQGSTIRCELPQHRTEVPHRRGHFVWPWEGQGLPALDAEAKAPPVLRVVPTMAEDVVADPPGMVWKGTESAYDGPCVVAVTRDVDGDSGRYCPLFFVDRWHRPSHEYGKAILAAWALSERARADAAEAALAKALEAVGLT